MASFYIPLSGLNADSTAMNTIANDLSNMNTTAFKSQTTNFSDLFTSRSAPRARGTKSSRAKACRSPRTPPISRRARRHERHHHLRRRAGRRRLLRGQPRAGPTCSPATAASGNTSGNLVTSGGQTAMGYPATNGVVNTSAPLTAITIRSPARSSRPWPPPA